MKAPAFFKEINLSSINSLNLPEELIEILNFVAEKTNEKLIGYHYKISSARSRQIYIRSKVLHDVIGGNESDVITISKIADGIKTADSFDSKQFKVSVVKQILKKYLLNYREKPTIVYSTTSILGEIMTMVCLSREFHTMSFYDFLDTLFFDRFLPEKSLQSIGVNTRIKIPSKKMSMMASIYDGKENTSYYEWLYSSYYGAKKIAENCGSGSSYEYHHEESDFVDFIKNSKSSDKNRCFTWMENYNKNIKKQFFSEGNKLSTADIYLVKKGKVNEIKKLFDRKVLFDADGNKMLNITEYHKIITRLYRIKNLFPVSLKQVVVPNPPYMVLNYSSIFEHENKDTDDWFYRQVLFLQQLAKDQNKFKEYVDKLIHIEDFTYNTQRATQKFYFRYTIKDESKVKSLNYFLEMVAGRGSILIKPLTTTSQTGEGQITYQVFNEMTNIASYKNYFTKAYNNLIRSRISILNSFNPNNSIATRQLRKVGVLSVGEMASVINSIEIPGNRKSANDKLKYDFMISYAEYLINKELPKQVTRQLQTKYKLLNKANNLNKRNLSQFVGFLTDLEFLYFLTSTEDVVKEYAKKKIIMSMHSAASGRGYLVVSSSRFLQNRMYLSNLKSALTVKVGN